MKKLYNYTIENGYTEVIETTIADLTILLYQNLDN